MACRSRPPAAGAAPVADAAVRPSTSCPPARSPGANQITVRIKNARQDGGFIGSPAQMYVEAGEPERAARGPWKYRVERQTNAGTLYTKPGELAAHVAFTAGGDSRPARAQPFKPVAPQAPDVVLRIARRPGQLKFDLLSDRGAGQLVEIVLESDAMQHNFVVGGGAWSDWHAADARALFVLGARVPDMPARSAVDEAHRAGGE